MKNEKNKKINSEESNIAKVYIPLLAMVLFLTSGFLSYKFIDKLIGIERKEPKNNDMNFEITVVNSIYMKNEDSYPNEYYFKDNVLYDSNNNKVNLTSFINPVYIEGYKIDEQSFINMNLGFSKIPKLVLDFSTVTDDCVEYFPLGLKTLSLNYCNYINDLSSLPYFCPELTTLSINGLSALDSLDFIYELKNLKQLDVSDSALLTEKLLNYLKENNIKTNITKEDVKIAKKIDAIFNEIIDDKMSDTEKIKAICLYIVKNYGYDSNLVNDSGQNPLRCMIANKKGVCTAYAYMANIMFNKAGIKSYVIKNSEHAWNLIEVDNVYYYIDVTNMYGNMFRLYLLNNLDFEKYYIKSPSEDLKRMITSPTDEDTVILSSLVDDIKTKNEGIIFDDLDPTEYEDKADEIDMAVGIVSLVTTPTFGFLMVKSGAEILESLKNKKKRG